MKILFLYVENSGIEGDVKIENIQCLIHDSRDEIFKTEEKDEIISFQNLNELWHFLKNKQKEKSIVFYKEKDFFVLNPKKHLAKWKILNLSHNNGNFIFSKQGKKICFKKIENLYPPAKFTSPIEMKKLYIRFTNILVSHTNKRGNVWTIGMLGRAILEDYYGIKIQNNIPVELRDEIRKFCYGARIEIFETGYLKDVVCYDRRGAYVEAELYPLPHKFITKDELDKYKNGYTTFRVCKIDTRIPCMPYKNMFPIGKFISYMTEDEYNYAINCRHVKMVDVLREYHFATTNVFYPFALDMFNKRKIDEIFKFPPNVVAGSFASKLVTFKKFRGKGGGVDDTAIIDFMGRPYIKTIKDNSHFAFPPIFAVIAARTRISLARIIEPFWNGREFEGVIMVNTDGIMIHKEYENLINKDLIGKEIGKLVKEDDIIDVRILTKQDYIEIKNEEKKYRIRGAEDIIETNAGVEYINRITKITDEGISSEKVNKRIRTEIAPMRIAPPEIFEV